MKNNKYFVYFNRFLRYLGFDSQDFLLLTLEKCMFVLKRVEKIEVLLKATHLLLSL